MCMCLYTTNTCRYTDIQLKRHTDRYTSRPRSNRHCVTITRESSLPVLR